MLTGEDMLLWAGGIDIHILKIIIFFFLYIYNIEFTVMIDDSFAIVTPVSLDHQRTLLL